MLIHLLVFVYVVLQLKYFLYGCHFLIGINGIRKCLISNIFSKINVVKDIMMEKIVPDLKFLTKEDLLNLCDEAQKPTALGKLAAISLQSIVAILDKQATDFYNEALYYSGERRKWFLFKLAAAILCIIFCPKISINHILFWANL